MTPAKEIYRDEGWEDFLQARQQGLKPGTYLVPYRAEVVFDGGKTVVETGVWVVLDDGRVIDTKDMKTFAQQGANTMEIGSKVNEPQKGSHLATASGRIHCVSERLRMANDALEKLRTALYGNRGSVEEVVIDRQTMGAQLGEDSALQIMDARLLDAERQIGVLEKLVEELSELA